MDITSNQSAYRFPLLKNDEIIECLSDAGIELTERELTEPHRHKEKVKAVFLALIAQGLRIPEESFKQTSITEMNYRQSLPHRELHEESFSSLKFFRTCQNFMKICGNGDNFGLMDLGAPTKGRFKRQLSAAINYLKYKEDRLALWTELHVQREELVEGLAEVNQEYCKWEETIIQAKAEAETRWGAARQIDVDCTDMEAEIAEQNKLQRRLRGESEELKKQASILKDKIETAGLALQEMDAEERKLLPKIVDSPDELKMKVAELNVALSQEQRRAQEAEQELRIMELRSRNVGKAQIDVSGATKLVNDLVEEKKKFLRISREADGFHRIIDENHNEVQRLKQIRGEQKIKVAQIGTHIEDNRRINIINLEEVQSALQIANAEFLNVEKDRREAKATLEQHGEDIKVIKTITKEEKDKADGEIANIVSSFRKVEQDIFQRRETFNQSIRTA